MQNTSMVSFDGGSASKVDDVTALPSRHKMADMCYYGNGMTTTRWWLCVTILHLQQYSHRLNFYSIFKVVTTTQRDFRFAPYGVNEVCAVLRCYAAQSGSYQRVLKRRQLTTIQRCIKTQVDRRSYLQLGSFLCPLCLKYGGISHKKTCQPKNLVIGINWKEQRILKPAV